MSLWSQVKRFVRALGRPMSRPRHRGDALARTARDAMGSRSDAVAGMGQVDRDVAKGADQYDKSFDD